ncbi:MAG: OmpA family protein [Ignavibacteria bacterium]|nr:OmpA family protein [Ignavibacteria bacterium]
MKKLVYLLVIVGLVVMSQQNYGQFKDWGTKFGIRGSILFPENEFANLGFSGNDNTSFDWFKTSYLGEAFFGFELSKALEMSINAGYGKYAGVAMYGEGTDFGEYETTIIPIHLRFRIHPFDVKGWNPYFYIGGGVMNFSVDKKPNVTWGKATEEDGWVAIIPAGIGAEFALGERVLLDFALGGALSSTYDLDSYRSGPDDIWDAYLNASLGLTFTGENCKADKDMDGLGKCLEKQIGTDPLNADTDGDGLNDGEEYLTYKTDPLKVDTDGDGLSDYEEVKNTKTNPLIADTDGDGLNDGEEVNKYKTDPLVVDTDKEGLSDYAEVMTHKTNPLLADTDKDGLTDAEEINKYKTNPLVADTDGDGLSDSEEVLKYKTNPLNKDTDAGTVDDYTEVKRGTDPLNAEDDVVKIGVPIILEGITFDVNKTTIKPESENTLMKALKTLQTYHDISVEIGGHTDSDGSAKSNMKLSEGRSESVKAWLVSKGIDASRITTKGYGEDKPIADNKTKEGKQKNRRIEFTRTK